MPQLEMALRPVITELFAARVVDEISREIEQAFPTQVSVEMFNIGAAHYVALEYGKDPKVLMVFGQDGKVFGVPSSREIGEKVRRIAKTLLRTYAKDVVKLALR